MSNVCAKLGEIHLPCVPRLQASDKKERARYDTRALLAAMNSTRKATVLVGVNDCIVRAQRYRSVYDKITRDIRERRRLKRKLIVSKLRAAVQLIKITGCIKAYTGFRRMERINGGVMSATCTIDEVQEGTEIIFVWQFQPNKSEMMKSPNQAPSSPASPSLCTPRRNSLSPG
jgi:hypothetical protein